MPLHLSVSTPSLPSHEISHKILGTLSTHPNFFLPTPLYSTFYQPKSRFTCPPPKKTTQNYAIWVKNLLLYIWDPTSSPSLESVADPETHGPIPLFCFCNLSSKMASYMAISVTGNRERLLTSLPRESTSAERVRLLVQLRLHTGFESTISKDGSCQETHKLLF